ncbi:unnamed protein product, partial [Symbiodinium sp. KB8]
VPAGDFGAMPCNGGCGPCGPCGACGNGCSLPCGALVPDSPTFEGAHKEDGSPAAR